MDSKYSFPFYLAPTWRGLISTTALLILFNVPTADGQEDYRREVIRAPESPPVTVQEDGTTILTGEALPEFIVVQNFFIEVHMASRDDQQWAALLDTLDIEPESRAAGVLDNSAGEVMDLAGDIGISGEGDPEAKQKSIAAAQRLGALWRSLVATVEATSGSADPLRRYLDQEVRRHGKLIISPESLSNRGILDTWQLAFEREESP